MNLLLQMRDILSKMAAKDSNMDVKVNVKLWRANGCHEFLASLSKFFFFCHICVNLFHYLKIIIIFYAVKVCCLSYL